MFDFSGAKLRVYPFTPRDIRVLILPLILASTAYSSLYIHSLKRIY
jgi:hypothetical protein